MGNVTELIFSLFVDVFYDCQLGYRKCKTTQQKAERWTMNWQMNNDRWTMNWHMIAERQWRPMVVSSQQKPLLYGRRPRRIRQPLVSPHDIIFQFHIYFLLPLPVESFKWCNPCFIRDSPFRSFFLGSDTKRDNLLQKTGIFIFKSVHPYIFSLLTFSCLHISQTSICIGHSPILMNWWIDVWIQICLSILLSSHWGLTHCPIPGKVFFQ